MTPVAVLIGPLTVSLCEPPGRRRNVGHDVAIRVFDILDAVIGHKLAVFIVDINLVMNMNDAGRCSSCGRSFSSSASSS